MVGPILGGAYFFPTLCARVLGSSPPVWIVNQTIGPGLPRAFTIDAALQTYDFGLFYIGNPMVPHFHYGIAVEPD